MFKKETIVLSTRYLEFGKSFLKSPFSEDYYTPPRFTVHKRGGLKACRRYPKFKCCPEEEENKTFLLPSPSSLIALEGEEEE